MNILVGDADRAAACQVRRLLERRKHAVTLVESGAEAWSQIDAGRTDAVIVAGELHEMSGFELIRKIRGQAQHARLPVLLLSAWHGPAQYSSAQTLGADDIVFKPIEEGRLLAQLGWIERLVAADQDLHAKEQRLIYLETEMQKMLTLTERHLAELHQSCRDLERMNAELKAQTLIDRATGLTNHAAFIERLSDETERARRYRFPLSVIMLDIDQFKAFNDTFGHPAGDAVLQRVAQILAHSAREADVPARYGGEEFAVVLPNTDGSGALMAADRLRRIIESEAWPLRAITVSVGASTRDPTAPDHLRLLWEADQALYQAKRSGRNRALHYAAPYSDLDAGTQ